MNPDAIIAWPIITVGLAALICEAIARRRIKRAARIRRIREAENARTIAHIRSLPLHDAIAAELARELHEDLEGLG